LRIAVDFFKVFAYDMIDFRGRRIRSKF